MKISWAGVFSAIVLAAASLSPVSKAQAADVAIAGFAFGGDFGSASQRFPHSFAIYQKFSANPASKNLSRQVFERAASIQNPAFALAPADAMVNLKRSDQALMTALVLTGETISTEDFGSYYKTFVNLRGDALIFDYKSQTVVRSYPLSVVLFDATKERPTQERIQGFVEQLLMRPDDSSLISQYVNRLSQAALPQAGTLSVQVKNAQIAPEALALLPEVLRNNPAVAEKMLAESFASILSAKLGLPMLPSSIGHTAGVMSMRLENGDDYNLKVGTGDYLFDLKLNKLVKIKQAENNVAAAYLYGAYANVHFFEPLQNSAFLKSDIKNGEAALIPAGQVSADDFPAYEGALRGLFNKLAAAIQEPGSKWISTAANAKDIHTQLDNTREILRKCR